MTKESIYELQKIDCNCNDCAFMVRDFDTYNHYLELHQTWQFTSFELKKKKLIEKSEQWAEKGNYEIATELFTEAEGLKFVFDRSAAAINYGTCSKFGKPVSFIPNVCQLETQQCFLHRKDSGRPKYMRVT